MKTNYWKKHSNRSWAISTKWQRIANWGQCSEIKSEPNFLGNSNACQQIASWHWTIQLPDQDTLCEIIIVWPLCVTNGSQSVLLSGHMTPSPLHELGFFSLWSIAATGHPAKCMILGLCSPLWHIAAKGLPAHCTRLELYFPLSNAKKMKTFQSYQ